MKCNNCGIEFEGRTDAKFCSPKCRVTFSRKQSIVTDNVTFKDLDVTDNFRFTVAYNRKPGDLGYDEDVAKQKSMKRITTYWYDVPLGAIPVYGKDWPKMPKFMNGRQYFLWWKNNFETQIDGKPIILNPLKVYEKLDYKMGGQGSRHWGAA